MQIGAADPLLPTASPERLLNAWEFTRWPTWTVAPPNPATPMPWLAA